MIEKSVLAVMFVLVLSFSFGQTGGVYNAFALYTATDPALSDMTAAPVVMSPDDVRGIGDKLFEGWVGFAGGVADIATTGRPIYTYDALNCESGFGAEVVVYEYVPLKEKQDFVSLDVGIGYLRTDAGHDRAELSGNINLKKHINLVITEIDAISVGANVQHGLNGKPGAGVGLSTKATEIFGIPVSKVWETIFSWAKEKKE